MPLNRSKIAPVGKTRETHLQGAAAFHDLRIGDARTESKSDVASRVDDRGDVLMDITARHHDLDRRLVCRAGCDDALVKCVEEDEGICIYFDIARRDREDERPELHIVQAVFTIAVL